MFPRSTTDGTKLPQRQLGTKNAILQKTGSNYPQLPEHVNHVEPYQPRSKSTRTIARSHQLHGSQSRSQIQNLGMYKPYRDPPVKLEPHENGLKGSRVRDLPGSKGRAPGPTSVQRHCPCCLSCINTTLLQNPKARTSS